MEIISPKKLIEVALPLDAINAASVRESYIYRGNPSALHKWWAQRPLVTARAVIFAQLVHDPEDLWHHQNPGQTPNQQVKGYWTKSRARLFSIIEDLVVWENTTNEAVLEKARQEIRKSWRDSCELNRNHPRADILFNPNKMPCLLDPFAGGGTIPLEAQRLGLEVHSSDLNPVAVIINKSIIEIPPRFVDKAPVHPNAQNPLATRGGAAGLAEDVRRYGTWMREEAIKRIGHLYPRVEATAAMAIACPGLKAYVGEKLTIIAWLWTRTVRSPNPAFSQVEVPLASTFVLSSKPGKEAYVQPVIENGSYQFEVRYGAPSEEAKNGTKSARGGNFRCLMSSAPISPNYIRGEGMAGRMGERVMAIVATGAMGRVYLGPDRIVDPTARDAKPSWYPDGTLPEKHRAFTPTIYGLRRWRDLFTPRQLVAMTTFADLVQEAHQAVLADATAVEVRDQRSPRSAGSNDATAYADAVATYLALSLSKVADYNCSLVPWYTKEDRPGHLFSKQAIPMVWDYAELNPLTDIGGTLDASVTIVANAIHGCSPSGIIGRASLCERRNWAEDARAYNEVVTGWSGIESEAAKVPAPKQHQPDLPGMKAT